MHGTSSASVAPGYDPAVTSPGAPEVPAWIARLPRFPLLDGPSPLQPLSRLTAALGGRVELWIKREDLLPLAFGGNKLRNLEFLVGAALAVGADTLVTSGRRWSNHARLTAAAGARAGLDVHLVLSGPPLREPGPNQRLDELLGATIHVTTGAARAERETRVAAVADELRAAGRRPYVIGVGGSGAVGAAGQVLAALETMGQGSGRGLAFDVVVVPSATGGTQAGLIAGCRLAGARTRVVGVAVAHPSAELAPLVEATLAGLAALAGRPLREPAVIDDRELGPGYGIPTAAAAEAARLLARSEGILVDPIYTAKALAALVRGVRDGGLTGRIVFWHAGGTPGLFEPLEG
jgi:1-aminocyclopropane-1-carboxylate deaminase/D-cysteine desulfhydrase-like pyridoxal-dependent ACC family enzyme